MNVHPKNDCTPDTHDWIESPFEAMTLACAWPGCPATKPAPVAAGACGSVSVVTVAVEADSGARAA